ncbi:hypothetical protein MD484_g6529, partial [Candolleomyces efflorescens]
MKIGALVMAPLERGNVAIPAPYLAPELWLQIISHLSPQDLLSLGQASQQLRGIINHRDVWAPLLRCLCSKRRLFAPSFPSVDDTGTATPESFSELQRAVLGPSRWAQAIQKHRSLTIASTPSESPESVVLEPRTRQLLDATCDTGNWTTPSHQYLVPGGRFLVVGSRNSIEMWDLGVVGKLHPPTPRLVSSVGPILMKSLMPRVPDEKATPVEIDVVPVRGSSEGLRVAVRALNKEYGDDRAAIRMYEIHPSSADPSFVERGNIILPRELQRDLGRRHPQLKVTDAHLFMGTSAYGILWDFINERYRFWFVRGEDSSDVVEVVLFGDHILHFLPQRGQLLVWRLSSLKWKKLPANGQLPTIDLQLGVPEIVPHVTASFPLTIPPGFCPEFILPASWYTSSSNITSFTFDIIFTAEDEYDIDYSTVTGGRYRLRMGPCIGHPPPDDDYDPPQIWEVECLAEFTFPENATEKGVSSKMHWGSRGDHPLNGLDDDCYATSISVFTGQGFRRVPQALKSAIYSVLPSLDLDAKGSNSKAYSKYFGQWSQRHNASRQSAELSSAAIGLPSGSDGDAVM